MKAPEGLLKALRAAERVALVTHIHPDGDGLGSQAALAEALTALGKRVFVRNQDPAPAKYAFLGLQRFAEGEGPCDLALVVDTSVRSRIGSAEKALSEARAVAVVDHHAGEPDIEGLRWIEPSAAAVGQMAWLLVEGLGAPLTPSIAGALYAALAWDTGCFRYSNSGPEVLELAARLQRAGADFRRIHVELFESQPEQAVRLQARALSDLRLFAEGRCALVRVSRELLSGCGASVEDCDGLVETARSIAGVELAALLREEDGSVKLSLRSKSRVDVNALAGRLGGGGHARAAGATLRMGLAEAEAVVAAVMSEALA